MKSRFRSLKLLKLVDKKYHLAWVPQMRDATGYWCINMHEYNIGEMRCWGLQWHYIDNIVSALTSVLLLQRPLAHDCYGDFERENAKLPRSLAEKYLLWNNPFPWTLRNLPVVDVEEPVEGEVKAQRNVDGSWIGGLKKSQLVEMQNILFHNFN